jgi:hypothetical protein
MHAHLVTLRRFAALAVAAAFFGLAAGCLVTSHSSVKESGARVSSLTLNQIRPGQTTESWLVAAAGEPSTKRSVDDHTSILRYEHVTTTNTDGTVLFLFAGGSTKEKSSTVIFEVTDGVIQRYWTEAS